jgi:VanZ family protein
MRFMLYRISALITACAILVLSVTPPLSIGHGGPLNSGIWTHVLAYCTLCFLLCMWLAAAGITSRPALYGALVSSMYGFFIECVQYALPYRTFQASDIVVNCCAALGAALVLHVAVFRGEQKKT